MSPRVTGVVVIMAIRTLSEPCLTWFRYTPSSQSLYFEYTDPENDIHSVIITPETPCLNHV